ncbi:hypothetical protein [Nonlabens arenilitoris]|nr:hypothetical protein [Nonlabens arenilitoris]
MNEQKIQELLDSLYKLKYDWNSGGTTYKSEVIRQEGRQNVENIIRAFLFDNRDEKQGVLEAKVFMYEQIISKSSFAPMLDKEALAKKDAEPVQTFVKLPIK